MAETISLWISNWIIGFSPSLGLVIWWFPVHYALCALLSVFRNYSSDSNFSNLSLISSNCLNQRESVTSFPLALSLFNFRRSLL